MTTDDHDNHDRWWAALWESLPDASANPGERVQVPRNPTKAMWNAANRVMSKRRELMGDDWFPVSNRDKTIIRWRAMIAVWEWGPPPEDTEDRSSDIANENHQALKNWRSADELLKHELKLERMRLFDARTRSQAELFVQLVKATVPREEWVAMWDRAREMFPEDPAWSRAPIDVEAAPDAG